MTLDTAKQIGRKYAVAAQLVTIIILELLWFFEEAGQDLANGCNSCLAVGFQANDDKNEKLTRGKNCYH